MATLDWQKLKTDAQDTIDTIDAGRMSKSSYALLGACVAILDHDEGDSAQPPITPIVDDPGQRESTPERTGILDDFSEVLKRYTGSRSKSDRDKMRETLKWQLGEIERELVEMRAQVHDNEAVKMFIDFRENIRLKL